MMGLIRMASYKLWLGQLLSQLTPSHDLSADKRTSDIQNDAVQVK